MTLGEMGINVTSRMLSMLVLNFYFTAIRKCFFGVLLKSFVSNAPESNHLISSHVDPGLEEQEKGNKTCRKS